MTIDLDGTVLSGAVDLFIARISAADDTITCYNRMLATTDKDLSVGVFPSVWTPDQDSYEMGHSAPGEPSLQRYQIGFHILSKDSDRVRGLAKHTAFARLVRMVLYRDTLLRLGLGQLTVTDSLGTESFRKGAPVSHRYLSQDIGNNTLAYLSVLDYSLETEMR